MVMAKLSLGWGTLWYRKKHIAFEKRPKTLASRDTADEMYNEEG
jgi:hypothetical protein